MNKQQELIEFLTNRLTKIEGVKALFLKGSLSSDTHDIYSDVDFYCLVTKETYKILMEERQDFLSSYRPVVYWSEVNFGNPQAIVIYDNCLHLDFYLTTKIPSNGTETLKVLYDPMKLIEDYQRLQREDEAEVIEYMSDIFYTFHELDIAIKRCDDLWANRLLSHMMAYLSLVHCHLFCPEKSVLHMKGVYLKLPDHLKFLMDQVLKYMVPAHFDIAIQAFIQLVDETIKILSSSLKKQLDMRYYDFMKKEVFCLSFIFDEHLLMKLLHINERETHWMVLRQNSLEKIGIVKLEGLGNKIVQMVDDMDLRFQSQDIEYLKEWAFSSGQCDKMMAVAQVDDRAYHQRLLENGFVIYKEDDQIHFVCRKEDRGE